MQKGAVDAVVPLLTIADKAEPTVHQRCETVEVAAAVAAVVVVGTPVAKRVISSKQVLGVRCCQLGFIAATHIAVAGSC